MTYRTINTSLIPAFVLMAAVACRGTGRDAHATSRTDAPVRSAAGEPEAASQPTASPGSVKETSSAGDVAQPGAPRFAPNHLGRIPILEYHVIRGPKNTEYTRTPESFRKDLEDVYARGYRPITVSQMLDKDFRDVPPGMSPVIFVFDDASAEQFSYIENNGQLEIDPTSGMGIWLDFKKSHPDWKNRATFCMLNGGSDGHNFFGDGPKWRGQRRQWRFEKVKWLADNGFELCGHTLWHAMLNKYSDAVVQEQIARNVMGIDSAVAGYRVRTFALPYGIWPKNRELAWRGSWTDPKTGKTHTYSFEAVLEVAGGPTRSPYDPQFNPHSITRIQAVGEDIRKYLDRLDATKNRFVQ
ncbi:MAG TPA: polysaccharide deacetylase family protein [Gemmatimonadaceae bacterium]|jgi:peptidoglycan/xylan/chitin deacetylase (PgdA/CDA1 family)